MQSKLQNLVNAHSAISKCFWLPPLLYQCYFIEAQHFRVKIRFFTIMNSLSSPCFYIAAKSDLDMFIFVAPFSFKHILQGQNLLLSNSWKAFTFTSDYFCIPLVLTQIYRHHFLRLKCAVATTILSKPGCKGIIPSCDETTSLALRRPGRKVAFVVIMKSPTSPISHLAQLQGNQTASFLWSNLYTWKKSVWTLPGPSFQMQALLCSVRWTSGRLLPSL